MVIDLSKINENNKIEFKEQLMKISLNHYQLLPIQMVVVFI